MLRQQVRVGAELFTLGFAAGLFEFALDRQQQLWHRHLRCHVQPGGLQAGVERSRTDGAAGHLEKSREVTRSGPYRWTRHPLYAGSALLAIGVVIASRSAIVALVAALYIGVTIPAAIRAEEAFLRRTFGDTYDRYQRSDAEPVTRRFSLGRALRNREYRAVAGLICGFALLALKVLLSI